MVIGLRLYGNLATDDVKYKSGETGWPDELLRMQMELGHVKTAYQSFGSSAPGR